MRPEGIGYSLALVGLTHTQKTMGKELLQQPMRQFEFSHDEILADSDSPQFTYTSIKYSKEQIKKLYEISKCNRGLISANLSVAIFDGMWPELSPDGRAVFIVEWLEKIKSVTSSESKNEWIEEFIDQDNL